ncbi:hypothetical protein N7448_002252 [Penicillium atrosanguineum]|uniref:Ankyrin repeat domain-containing protein n=1 Tax=Penicillium atrosanguineum TaxID=1132637 RepID=A0A9W9PVK6_9EURO|nr:hypothetical protein N7448_002252 [Penicillium atrosanguineum]KAJ5311294.1 hypothetical protein N7476_007154 [Penicillium atrosanguineum]
MNYYEYVVEALRAHEQIDINAYDLDGYTPISIAARHGNVDIVKMLLARGANPGAVEKQKLELVRLLVNREDADLNALRAKSTLLQSVVDRNNEDLIKILLTDPRVDPDLTVRRDAQTPLLRVTLKNNTEMVQMLLVAGANKNLKDKTGLSPAMLLEASAEAREELERDRGLFGSKSLSKLGITVDLINPKDSLSQLLVQIERSDI